MLRPSWLLLPLLGMGLVAGCNEPTGPGPGATSWPAGAAGVACNYLEYDQVADKIGTRFDTAGGAQVDETYTCALTQADQEFPDLTLSMAATTATNAVFQATVAPAGSTIIKGLGKIAYQASAAASGKRGPTLEVGWLSAKGRLMIMRFTFPATAPAAEVDTLAPKLIALAQAIEVGFATPTP